MRRMNPCAHLGGAAKRRCWLSDAAAAAVQRLDALIEKMRLADQPGDTDGAYVPRSEAADLRQQLHEMQCDLRRIESRERADHENAKARKAQDDG
jgi:uncharacterized membrane protein